MNRFLVLLFLVGCSLMGRNQAIDDLNYYLNKYPGDNVVNTLDKIHLVIDFDDDGELTIVLNEEKRAIYLTDNAAQYSSSSIVHSEHYQLEDIEAYSLVPNGNKYKKIKVEDFATKTETSPGIFHNGTKSENFIFPSLKKGAISVESSQMKLGIPQLLSGFYLESYYPTEEMQIQIDVAEGIELAFSYVHADDAKHKPTISKTKNGSTYKWQIKDIPAFEYDSDAPSITYYSPHIIPRIASYQKNGEEVRILKDVGDLYNWYFELVEQTDKTPSEGIKSIVDSLTNGATDNLEKASRIYYWVQDNIKYVAFEEGMQGFIPDDASNVCSKKYGDCKGITSLLYAMMRYAQIDAYFTWVGTRDRPYTYEEMPAPIVDNHMILTFKYNDAYYFVDGTSPIAPINEPTSFILGKEVLIAIDKDNYDIVQVPVNSNSYTVFSDSVYLELEQDDLLKGSGETKISGFYNTDLKSVLKSTSKENTKRFMEAFLEKGHNKFRLDDFRMSDLHDRNQGLNIAYEFELADYVSKNEDEVYINLALDKSFKDAKLSEDRVVPFEVDYKSKNHYTVVLSIPDGYEATYLPEAQQYKSDEFGFSYKVSQQENKIVQQLSIYDNFLLLNKDRFDDWNKMVKSIKNAYRESIILKRIN